MKGFDRELSAGNESDRGRPSSFVLQPVLPSAVDPVFGGQLVPGTAGRACEGHTAAAADGSGGPVLAAATATPAAAGPLYRPASNAAAANRPTVTERFAVSSDSSSSCIPLRQLELSTAGLEDADIENHLQLYRSTLQVLDLSGNTCLTAAGLAALAPFTSLTKLVLRELRVAGSCLQALASLTQLRSLDLTSSQMAQCMGWRLDSSAGLSDAASGSASGGSCLLTQLTELTQLTHLAAGSNAILARGARVGCGGGKKFVCAVCPTLPMD